MAILSPWTDNARRNTVTILSPWTDMLGALWQFYLPGPIRTYMLEGALWLFCLPGLKSSPGFTRSGRVVYLSVEYDGQKLAVEHIKIIGDI